MHRRCAFIKMKQLGMMKELKFLSNQISMEKFMEIKTNPPPVPILMQPNIQIPIKRYCKIHDIFLPENEYKIHMNQHYREASTDSLIEKQYIGIQEKKIEVYVCLLHSKRAIQLPSGEWSCPMLGCNEIIQKKMITVKDEEDYFICLIHQCKISYNVNLGKAQCQNKTCQNNDWIRRSYFLTMVKEGYIEYRGAKIPIDIDTRTVSIAGQRIILKI